MLPTDTALRFPLLCRAWGESELPSVRIVNTPAEIREFLVAEWLGEEGEKLDEVMQLLNDPEGWEGETRDMFSLKFEIGGVSLERVHASGAASPDGKVSRQLEEALLENSALREGRSNMVSVLKTLADKTDDLIVHLKHSGRLAPCFNLPALTSARAALAEAGTQAHSPQLRT